MGAGYTGTQVVYGWAGAVIKWVKYLGRNSMLVETEKDKCHRLTLLPTDRQSVYSTENYVGSSSFVMRLNLVSKLSIPERGSNTPSVHPTVCCW